MERSNAKIINPAGLSKQSRLFKRCYLIWMLLPLLLLTQCGAPQQSMSQATVSPPVLSSSIYLSDQAGVDVFQVPDEKHLWQFHPQQQNTFNADNSLFTVHQGTVYYATDSLYALNAQTGQQNWEITFDQQADALVASDAIVYASVSDTVYALRAHDGSTLWHQAIHSDLSPISILLLHDNMLYASRGGTLFGLDPATGLQLWRFDIDPGIGERVTDILPVKNTPIILIESGSTLDALNEYSGQVLWHKNIQVQSLKIIGDRLYSIFTNISSASSNNASDKSTTLTGLQAISVSTGKQIWQTNTPISGGLAAIEASTIYWAKGHDIAAWSTTNGAPVWHTSDTDTYQGLVAIGNRVITETSHGNLNAFEATNGHLLWQQPGPTGSTMELHIVQNILCGIDKVGTVVGISLENGMPLWYAVSGNPVHQLLVDQ